MGLNPSCNNVVGNALPVLGDPPFPLDLAARAKEELLRVLPEAVFEDKVETREVYRKGTRAHQMASAGMHFPGMAGPDDIETIEVQAVRATALGWTFQRAWYYWICTTADRPIPRAEASRLNETWRKQVRVDGFAGGRDVRADVQGYHVDTADGLAALVAAIRQIPVYVSA